MELADYLDCTGCGLCVHACPGQCIAWKRKELGHEYPVIDSSRCIECGMCKKVCPVFNKPQRRTPDVVYAGWAKDEDEYRSSTSGAAAALLSKAVLQRGGVVYGCTALPRLSIKHVRVDRESDISRLKGSKYVKSDLSGVFASLKEDISLGNNVLFIGTPCQVSAVANLNPSRPENLFLIDMVCHGVPSQNFLRNYFSRELKISPEKIATLRFRKDNEVRIEAFDAEGIALYRSREYRTDSRKDPYYACFMKGYSFRESCYRCAYSCSERVSDMTIGDFWGLGKMYPCDLPSHDYGVSLLMPLTAKGNQLIDLVRDKMYLYERPVDEAIQGNMHLHSPQKKNYSSRLFRKLYPFFGVTRSFKLVDLLRHFRIFLNSRCRLVKKTH